MSVKRLFDIIGLVDERHIEDGAHVVKTAKKSIFIKITPLQTAAALLLTFGVVMVAFITGNLGGMSGMGSDSSSEEGIEDSATSYLAYQGPILPLSLSESDNIKAVRDMTFDFDQSDGMGELEISVQDSYQLKNSSDSTISTTLYYPVVTSYQDFHDLAPTLLIDGEIISPEIYVGARDAETNLNNFTDYEALLFDGVYKADALNKPDLPDNEVTMYELSNHSAHSEEYPAATITIEFEHKQENARVMGFGFTGFSGWENHTQFSYDVPMEHEADKSNYLMAIGGIGEIGIQGYKNGAIEDGNELDSIGSEISLYESTVGDGLMLFTQEFAKMVEYSLPSGIDNEEFAYSAYEVAESYVTFENDHLMFYIAEDVISYAYGNERVFYLAYDVEIPANATLEVAMSMTKPASYNYGGSGQDEDARGFDMATKLDSNINFSEQNVHIKNHSGIDIVSSNLGFDLEGGVEKVAIDMSVERYYLDVIIREE